MAEQTKNSIEKRVEEFSTRPGPRYFNQGKASGEEFYDDYLSRWFNDAMKQNKSLTVVLDGTDGYLTSFIDEAFGRLVYYYGKDTVDKNLRIVSRLEPEWITRLNNKTFPAWEDRRIKRQEPLRTRP